MDITSISVERLLEHWRWLCAGSYELVDISDFGDLFLIDVNGTVLMLDLQAGKLEAVAPSRASFEDARFKAASRNELYFEDVSSELQRKGLKLQPGRVFGYKLPTCFKESSGTIDNVYLADLYEYVSFMGSLHKQIASAPDGSMVKLVVKGN